MNIEKLCLETEENNYCNASGSNQYTSPVQSNVNDIKLYDMSFFNFYFHDPSFNPLSPRIFVVWFLHSKPLLAVWIQNSESIMGKHTKHLRLTGSLPGAQGRAMSEKAVKPTLWSSCNTCLYLKWILSKTEAHHVVTVLSPSLCVYPFPPFFSCYLALYGTADELGIEFMGKTTFHWMCGMLDLSCAFASVKYHTKHTIHHNKAAHLGKLMWASRHGNTVVVN